MAWKRVNYGNRENPGCYDTGNGAIAYIDENPKYPDVERVRIVPYAKGRGGPETYYRFASDANGAFVRAGACGYDTLKACLDDHRFHHG